MSHIDRRPDCVTVAPAVSNVWCWRSARPGALVLSDERQWGGLYLDFRGENQGHSNVQHTGKAVIDHCSVSLLSTSSIMALGAAALWMPLENCKALGKSVKEALQKL